MWRGWPQSLCLPGRVRTVVEVGLEIALLPKNSTRWPEPTLLLCVCVCLSVCLYTWHCGCEWKVQILRALQP